MKLVVYKMMGGDVELREGDESCSDVNFCKWKCRVTEWITGFDGESGIIIVKIKIMGNIRVDFLTFFLLQHTTIFWLVKMESQTS